MVDRLGTVLCIIVNLPFTAHFTSRIRVVGAKKTQEASGVYTYVAASHCWNCDITLLILSVGINTNPLYITSLLLPIHYIIVTSELTKYGLQGPLLRLTVNVSCC